MTEVGAQGDATKALLKVYYDALNLQDMDTVLSLLTDDVVHDINQGQREVGKAAFREFLGLMSSCYREHFFNIEIMSNEDGSRAASEFNVLGVYLANADGMPAAYGQTYRLPGGAFFEIQHGKIARVSVHYNLQDWLAQIGFQKQVEYG